MKLYEYLAKERLARYGIPTPGGRVAQTPAEARRIAEEIGPCAVKAQVLVGGRGKAGGIKLAETPDEAEARAREILGMNLKGHVVERVLVEPKLSIDQELYLSIAIDTTAKRPLIMASASGGVNIEEVPEEKICKQTVDIQVGAHPYLGRAFARRLGLKGDLARQFADLLVRLYRLYRECDAELVEINPLAVVGDRLIAADGRLNIDDDALFRHTDLPRVQEGTELEQRVRELGLAYVELDGDIAVMANGAGMAMATLDVLQHYGGRPANFLDAGGGAAVEPTARAIEILLATNPRAMFINIFGGITRCDDVANAIVQVQRSRGIPVPLVVRLVGTNEAEGVRILREAGIQAHREMGQAAQQVVELARAGGGVAVVHPH